MIFPQCVRSLVHAVGEFKGGEHIELIVVDYQSDDLPLETWFKEAVGSLPARVITKSGAFSKGEGLNRAAAAANGEWLFLCDADMLVNRLLLSRGMEVLSRGEAFAPICRRLRRDGSLHKLDFSGRGNVFVTKSVFEKVGGVPEFMSWGGEDNIFCNRVSKFVTILREHIPGFNHLWHPERCRHENHSRPPRSDFTRFYWQRETAPDRCPRESDRRTGDDKRLASEDPEARGTSPHAVLKDSELPLLICLCATYRRPRLLANLIYCFEQFDYPRNRCQLLVLDDLGQFPDQPCGSNWRVVSRRARYPTLGDKRNALVDLAPQNCDAFVVMDDDDVYLPWALRAHAWALRHSELSCPDRVLLEDSDMTLIMEPTVGRVHSAWAYTRDLFLRCGRYPSVSSGEDFALLRRMRACGVTPYSATDVWPPWVIARWDGTESYHLSALDEDGYTALAPDNECDFAERGLAPTATKDWATLVGDFFGFQTSGTATVLRGWQSCRKQVERTMIENRARIAAMRRRRRGYTRGRPMGSSS